MRPGKAHLVALLFMFPIERADTESEILVELVIVDPSCAPSMKTRKDVPDRVTAKCFHLFKCAVSNEESTPTALAPFSQR